MALAPKQGLRRSPAPATTASAVVPAAPAAPVADTPGFVKVQCIVSTGPFTHEKRLEDGEIAEVPVDVAELMAQRGQVKVL